MGMNKDLLIINALKPIGSPRYTSQGIKFNCPHCEELGNDPEKYNLEINTEREIYKCWACNYNGSLYKLIKERGHKEYLEFFHKDKTDNLIYGKKKYRKVELPKKLINVLKTKEPLEYLLKRGFTKDFIYKRNIKYCYGEFYNDHIIFPSYDKNDLLNYWIALDMKTGKYLKCPFKTNILFYEKEIDFNLPVILVEGIFDITGLPNSVPLLGLRANDYILDLLANKEVIVILDPLADRKLKSKLVYDLKSVCKKINDYVIPATYKDPNEAFLKGYDYKKDLILYY